ncbi:MAG TPA: hypothetical protein VIL74_14920 [Pyrinomonadaceae bacterium]|jgi:DNA-directed RNA polymerase specialized sigma24 family protein
MPKALTSESFAKLLQALSPDEAESARLYTKLHKSLANYFALKGIAAPDDAADETIDRIPERINEDTKKEDIRYIAFSVARYVFLEKIRKEQKRARADERFYEKNGDGQTLDENDGYESLRDCFQALYERERELLVRYFADLEAPELFAHRQKLAAREGIDLNALRNRISRLRRRLEDCADREK